MEGDASAPTNGGPVTGSATSVASIPQASEAPKTSPVASMSGALQGEDAKDVDEKSADGLQDGVQNDNLGRRVMVK